jgi:hypothetical protein
MKRTTAFWSIAVLAGISAILLGIVWWVWGGMLIREAFSKEPRNKAGQFATP